jgi:hypothetical protein
MYYTPYRYALFYSPLFIVKCRSGASGEVANQQVHMPGILPKVPGRFYYYFGKPIETEGMFFPCAYFIDGNTHEVCDGKFCFANFNLLRYCLTGRKLELKDREKSQELYFEVQSEVERCIAYLKEKRESDPYRSILSRLLYQATHGFTSDIPTFEI